MQIVVHISSFYDWQPVPPDVEVSPEDIAAKLVKPSSTGGWMMRVERQAATHTHVAVPEHEIATTIIGDAIREHTALTRAKAAAVYLARHVMPHHAHRSAIQRFEVEVDDAAPDAFAAQLAVHVAAGHVPQADVADLIAAYAAPTTSAGVIAALCDHFRVTPQENTP